MSDLSLISDARLAFHQTLIDQNVLSVNDKGIPSNADKASVMSKALASSIYDQIANTNGGVQEKLPGQTSGNKFEAICVAFLNATFPRLQNLRPGKWTIEQTGSGKRMHLAEFQQYEHLTALYNAAKGNPELAAVLGNDYTITPDIVIGRKPETDTEINAQQRIVDKESALLTGIRQVNKPKDILHASISCKWTMRSDRAQNSRAEALNLIRNRKGPLPHTCVITGEPLPSRISSLALGTGDIDRVYHFALHELEEALRIQDKAGDSYDQLKIMIDGERLRDISDLPLDLTM